MSGEESYVRARWAAAAADAAELRGQLDAAGRTEVLLRARVAELEEALGPFAGWWERYGAGEIATEAVAAYQRAHAVLSSGAEPGAGGGQQT